VIRFILGFPLVVFWMFGIGIPGLLCGLIGRERALLVITRSWARLILLCAGVRVQVEGREHVPAGPAVFAANHVSALDVGVDRKNAFRAKRSLTRAAERIHAGMNVAVFPEGTRSRDGRLQAFKRGSFVLAQDAGVPVVPVSLVGVKAIVPRGLVHLRPGRVVLRLHPAISTQGRTAQAVADEVHAVIARDFAESAA
jgi:1-acyl-sn-glycerol-3-phosphate acyltransferase